MNSPPGFQLKDFKPWPLIFEAMANRRLAAVGGRFTKMFSVASGI